MTEHIAGARIVRAAVPSADVSAAAFTFSPANDEAPDRIAAKVRTRGLAAVGAPRGALAVVLGAQLTGIRLWSMAGSMFLDGVARFHGDGIGRKRS
jgi:hypothetical protein